MLRRFDRHTGGPDRIGQPEERLPPRPGAARQYPYVVVSFGQPFSGGSPHSQRPVDGLQDRNQLIAQRVA